jgi:NAD(P)H-dependent flavin oxidoreductase YrpB (nitropropane dioxygenase family)
MLRCRIPESDSTHNPGVIMKLPPEARNALLDVALSDQRVKALWFSFGDFSAIVEDLRKRRPDILIFHQLHSAHEVVESLRRGHADVIVAQGTESGGHGRWDGTGTGALVLLPEVVAAVKKWETEEGNGKKVPDRKSVV